MRGERNVNWKGGTWMDSRGYVLILTESGEYRPEHRLAMERKLGRPLTKREQVHHINHNPSDNRIENLRLYRSAGVHAMTEHVQNGPDGRFRSR
jgi:hypothetical protein